MPTETAEKDRTSCRSEGVWVMMWHDAWGTPVLYWELCSIS